MQRAAYDAQQARYNATCLWARTPRGRIRDCAAAPRPAPCRAASTMPQAARRMFYAACLHVARCLRHVARCLRHVARCLRHVARCIILRSATPRPLRRWRLEPTHGAPRHRVPRHGAPTAWYPTAWYPPRHSIPDGMVSHGTVSHGMVSVMPQLNATSYTANPGAMWPNAMLSLASPGTMWPNALSISSRQSTHGTP